MIIINKKVIIDIPGIIVLLKNNLRVISYKEADLIEVSLELNLDYLSNNSDEVSEFNKNIELKLDDVSNFMSLDIKKYEIFVVENSGIELNIEFDIQSVIEDYKDEIIKKEEDLFDEVLERKCPNVLDDVNKSIYFNSNPSFQEYKIIYLNEDTDLDDIIKRYNIKPDQLYTEDLRLLDRVIIRNERKN